MQTQVLVVGLGLAGTWVSHWLQQAGIDFLVMDAEKEGSSTPVASGVINPVTGRRLSTTWMADKLLPFANQAYTALEKELEIPIFSETRIVDFFGAPDKRLAFLQKHAEGNPYLQLPENENNLHHLFQYDLGYGIIQPAYRVNLPALLKRYKTILRSKGKLIEEEVQSDAKSMLIDKQLNGIQFEYLILCHGKWAAEAGLFAALPFSLNKGEALLIDFKGDEPPFAIYKKGNTLLPWQDGLWWAGSTYNNRYTTEAPEPQFRLAMQQWVASLVKTPFTVADHLSAVRPATIERRPFVGWHPRVPHLGLLNGLGTKGVSLAPYFAQQVVQSITLPTAVDPLADVKRFSGLLGRTT